MKALVLIALLSTAAGATEHVLIHPYPGSSPAGKDVKKNQDVTMAGLKVHGTVERFVWKNPKKASPDEVYAAYEKEMLSAGFGQLAKEGRSFTGKLVRRELGDAYGLVEVQPDKTTLTIVETQATPEQLQQHAQEIAAAVQRVTAQTLNESLSKDGHVALGDILYKPGEVALRPEAAPVVKEIAALMRKDPSLRLYVVGHTDTQGTFKGNIGISRKRAEWLVKHLVNEKVPKDRLLADGVGPLAPIASNDTEEGRSRNRRVELVRQ